MQEYVCHFLNEGRGCQRIYHAATLPDAMASHNVVMPEFSESVVKWVSPSGVTFLMHDSNLTIQEDGK